jgi:hypothetical protein
LLAQDSTIAFETIGILYLDVQLGGKIMRAKGRKQGRFVALSGLTKLATPLGSQYPLLIVDSTGSPVFFLCEWYRRKKAIDPGRTSDTYLVNHEIKWRQIVTIQVS